jgi:hypothetical protein
VFIFFLELPFFLGFIDQTLGTKLAIKFRVSTGNPLLKTFRAVSDLMFLTGEHPFPVRMVATLKTHAHLIP